ncbi:ankyrin repeat domain-containing protein [Wolbachia endosymbiont (group A) of Rhinocyllus conicus]|uniref:ankyrin repeat domain-containing protein n=1 Tax=Wolbachia endosymbiont (group A) of Rhinocyllus conicus TaxID=2954053 RepID=UPI00222607F1|nr:ankyrin repeat domain-containing protein [Wolbachia endosymbiont (group A) of Rhinocyllus conicus]
MTTNYQQWREIFSTVNSDNKREIFSTVNSDNKLDKSNVIEKVKEELKANNEEVFKQWEKSDFYVNYKFEVGDNEFTLLHLTAQWGYTGLTKALIVAKGIDVNIKDKNEKTPLHLAAENGYKEVVDALLEKDGIKINEQDKDGWTPLHLALIIGHVDVVNSLIENGANVNIKDDYGMPPLFFILRDYVVTPSKARKVSVNMKNCAEHTPRDLAKEEKQPTSATMKGFFAGSATALSGAIIAIALSATGTVKQPTLIAAVATAALVVGGATYALLKPSTKVDGAVLTNGQKEAAHASL